MTAPARTLLQIAKAPGHPSPLDASVLVIIDAQQEYQRGGLPLAGIDAAVAETANLLAMARRKVMPIFHVVHHGPAGGALFDVDGPLVAIIPGLEPAEGEKVVVKTLPNAFARTSLLDDIRATGRKEIILAGFMTHMCVSSTARGALDLGFRTTVVAAAAATRDLPDPVSGAVIPAATVHRTALAELADRFAVIAADSEAWTAPAG